MLAVNHTTEKIYNSTQARISLRESNERQAACNETKTQALESMRIAKQNLSSALAVISSLQISSYSTQLDSAYSDLNCAIATDAQLEEFEETFFTLANQAATEAGAATIAFNSAKQTLDSANTTLASLEAKASGNSEVVALSENVEELYETLSETPQLSALGEISSRINGNATQITDISNKLNDPFGGNAGILLIVVGILGLGAGAFAFTRKKRVGL